MKKIKHYLGAAAFKMICTKGDKKRDEGKTISETIEVINGEYYGAHDQEHLLQMYRLKNSEGKLPVIVSIHGGGYVYGSIETYQYYCAELAKEHFFVVNFNYPLAPKATYPEILDCVDDVMNYLVKNAERFNLDLGHVFIVGDSAGAQMACQYGILYSNPAYQKLFNIEPKGFCLKALGLNCGFYDFKGQLNGKGLSAIIGAYFGDKAFERYGEKLKMTEYLTKDFPPSFIMSFGGDFLLPCDQPFVDHLEELTVQHEFKVYGDQNYGHVYHVDVDKPMAIEANRDELAFFKQFL